MPHPPEGVWCFYARHFILPSSRLRVSSGPWRCVARCSGGCDQQSHCRRWILAEVSCDPGCMHIGQTRRGMLEYMQADVYRCDGNT